MDAQKRFWKNPDLLSQLLPFLDPSSILNLANLFPLIPQLLQRRAFWRDLISRNIDDGEGFWEDYQKVVQLVGILKMMERPGVLIQDLLEAICEKFEEKETAWKALKKDWGTINGTIKTIKGLSMIRLNCGRHHWHIMRSEGFQLLELAEAMMGTCLQQITGFQTNNELFYEEGLGQALLARLSRQTQEIGNVSFGPKAVLSAPRKGLIATLLQRAESVLVWNVDLRGFDEEDWFWLAKLVQYHSKEIFLNVIVNKETLGQANLEDLKIVWDATYEEAGSFQIFGGQTLYEDCRNFCEECEYGKCECGWKRLQEIWRGERPGLRD